MKEKLILEMLNPFAIFCLMGGVILGVLNGYPNTMMMLIVGLVEGTVFYLLALFFISMFTSGEIK